ncbi:hypothetical protein EfmAA290_00920 [Enterococcus faecium]|nr:hypothetical protein EfmAA290_00920 [Enterococcus faecium]
MNKEHTENPGEVLNYGQKFGSLVKIKVDNMRLQHETILEHDEQAVQSILENEIFSRIRIIRI